MSWRRLISYVVVFALLVPIWAILGGINESRSRKATWQLSEDVSHLFGGPVEFTPPQVTSTGVKQALRRVRAEDTLAEINGEWVKLTDQWSDELTDVPFEIPVELEQHQLHGDVTVENRSRGLVEFTLFTVDVDAQWTFQTDGEEEGSTHIRWMPPSVSMLEDFEVRVDGQEMEIDLQGGVFFFAIPSEPARRVVMEVDMKTRGRSVVGYRASEGALKNLRDVDVGLTMNTGDYDLPKESASPTTTDWTDGAAQVRWVSDAMITDRGFLVSFADPMQPGALASRLSLSAPWSLWLFVCFIGALVVVRDIDFHPIHLLLTGFSFFAFNLLFSYLVDVVGVPWAFGISSVVSVALMTTYLSRAVSPQFGFKQAGIAQLVFLVGFALANTWEGMTGLSITITGIATLAAIMHITAKVDWTRTLSRDKVGA